MNSYHQLASRFGLALGIATTLGAYCANAQAQLATPALPVAAPTRPILENVGETPTLERVLALARERAPEVNVGRAEVEASRSLGVGARVSPLLNPYLEVIAERGGRGVTQDVALTAQLHTPVEVAGQRSRRIAEADAFVDWRTTNLEQLRAQISGATVRSFGDCIAHAARVEALNELLVSAETESGVFSLRRDAGDATERDAQLAEVERTRIAVQLEESRAMLGASLSELGRLAGQRFMAPSTSQLFPSVTFTSPDAGQATSAPAVRSAQAEARFFGRADERLERDRIPPVSVIFQAGRGDFAEARLGAGLAWSLPVFRYNQGERAKVRAEADRARATGLAYTKSIAQRLASIAEESSRLRLAAEILDREAIPAAALSAESASRMQNAGKTDLLSVIVARRDLYMLKLRRLEIAQRSWQLLGNWVELTGTMPRQGQG